MDYGTTTFNGQTYKLAEAASLTNRVVPNGYDAANDGEEYDFEMAANAIDKDGQPVRAYWIFTGTKGENDPELDTYDYSVADGVIIA